VKRRPQRVGGVQVSGVGNLLTQVAGCCKPLPGDSILGFITQGRGVSIHRRDCSRLLHLQVSAPERIVDIQWGELAQSGYEVDIGIEAYDRPGLLRDISELLAQARINVISVNTQTNQKRHTATMRLTAEVSDLTALGKLLDRIVRLNNVISAVRLSEDGVQNAG
jgi:GTP pyrophosphokinase